MMNEDRLKDYIIKRNNGTWNLGGYKIPKLVYSPKLNSKYISPYQLRIESIKTYSRFEEDMKKTLIDLGVPFISEFPIPIYDRDLWYNLCKEECESYIPDIYEKVILLIDFFLPGVGYALEVDGLQHVSSLIQSKTDIIRDKYLLKKYNLPTKRFFRYIEDSSGSDVSSFIELHPGKEEQFKFEGMDEDILIAWKRINSEEYNLLKNLSKRREDRITLKKNYAYDISRGWLKDKTLREFNELISFVCGKTVKLIP